MRVLMGHLIYEKDEVYRLLAERLNKNPVGAPVNDTLMAILHRLYTETEAMVGSKLPLLPMTLDQIAAMTGIDDQQLLPILDSMADKGLVLDIPRKDTRFFFLAPMVIGFFEYTFMRVRGNVDMQELAALFQTYFHDKEVLEEFAGVDTRMDRTLVYESVIPLAVETEVLPYERVSEVIRQSGGGAISICPCRHKAVHLGTSCGAPLEVCTTLGSAAEWLVRRGMGKPATVDEMLRVLDQTEKLGLVHNCDNVLNKPTFICHCCGCCCVVLAGIKESGKYFTHPSNFLPEVDPDLCIGCGICVDSCQIHAVTMNDEANGAQVSSMDREKCIGCGVCASTCPEGAVSMTRRQTLHVPPKTLKEKFVRIAREKGKI
jgi:formate hydrogenlyase subunit 6/NADH:ubiquinone oxidoreductase subunit I